MWWIALVVSMSAALGKPSVPAVVCETGFAGAFKDAARVPGARGVCRDVASECIRQGVDPLVCASVAFKETRFKNLPSHAGRRWLSAFVAKGGTHATAEAKLPSWAERTAVQCKPKYFCLGRNGRLPNDWRETCPFLERCVAHLKRQLDNPRKCSYAKPETPFAKERRICYQASRSKRVCNDFWVACRPVKKAMSADLRMVTALDRYKYPFAPSGGYGGKIWPVYARLRGDLRRAGETSVAAWL